MIDTVGTLIKTWSEHFGCGGVALAVALESCLLPLPSEIVMPVAGAFTTGTMGPCCTSACWV